jgi:hypothetical protein
MKVKPKIYPELDQRSKVYPFSKVTRVTLSSKDEAEAWKSAQSILTPHCDSNLIILALMG